MGKTTKKNSKKEGQGNEEPLEGDLTEKQQEDLQKYEATVKQGFSTFMAVGQALVEIQRRKLYRNSHKSFEDYCEKELGFGRYTAYNQINAYKIGAILETEASGSLKPQNEYHVRALTRLLKSQKENALLDKPEGREQLKKVWSVVCEKVDSGKRLTGHLVQDVVKTYRTGQKNDSPSDTNLKNCEASVYKLRLNTKKILENKDVLKNKDILQKIADRCGEIQKLIQDKLNSTPER